MKAILALLEVVPSWLWAAVVVALVALCTHLHLGGVQAREAASSAARDLLAVQLTMRTALLTEMEKARAKEAPLLQVVQEANDAVTQARLDLGAVVVAADGRLRKFSRPLRVCGSDTGQGAAAAAGPGEAGQRGAGLPDVAGGDLLLIDGPARLESARLAAVANQYAAALSECVKTWGAASVATSPD